MYSQDGRVQEMHDYTDFLNGSDKYMNRKYSYDVYDRVTSMVYTYSENPNEILERYDYEYDKDSNVTGEHVINNYEGNCRDVTTVYTYDCRNRLVQSKETDNLTYKETVCKYEYDKVSNRTKKTEDGVETVYTYNKLNQLIKSVETEGNNSYTTTYEYDKVGNQTRVCNGKNGTVTEYKYDTYRGDVKQYD